MAQNLKPLRVKSCELRVASCNPKLVTRNGFILAGFLVAYCAVAAEPLPDPTRPPAGMAGEGSPGAPAATAPAGPVLQSVLIAPKRRAAIISGETVELGGKYQDAKLIRVSEGEAVLKTEQGLQTLKLFPQVEKRVIVVKKPGAAKARKSSAPAGKTGKGQE